MAQPQYYEIQKDKNAEPQYFTNVEDQTVQYVITPDTTQTQFPNQQITQDQVIQAQIVQQPIIQQLQPSQFTLIKDGTLRQEGQQIFFVDKAIADGIVIENKIQQQIEIPQQPIVLNHQLANTRGPIMKTGLNQHVSLELIQKNPQQQKSMQRSPNPNQHPVRQQMSPALAQMRQQMNASIKSNQIQGQTLNQQQQVRMQHQANRPNMVRTGLQQQFRPLQHNVGIRQIESNQIRQTPRMPNQAQLQRPTQLMRTSSMVTPRAQAMIAQQQQQQQSVPQLVKFSSQGTNSTETKIIEEQETVTLPDGAVVTVSTYNNMLREQKSRNVPKKPNAPQQPNPMQHQNSPMQQHNQLQTQNNSMQQQQQQQQPPNQVQQSTQLQQPANQLQQSNTQIQQQTNQLQQNNPMSVPNIRPVPSPKKRAATPRAPRNPPKGGPRAPPRPRAPQNQNLAQQQQQNSTQGHFSMLNQPQQQVNKIQQPPQQFQNQNVGTPFSQQQAQLQQQQQQQAQLQQQMQQQQQQQQQAQLQQQQARKRLSQANYVIQPPKPNQKPAQPRPLPPYIASSQIQKIIESTPVSEEFSDSIRMLVLLENGEQRLITFTLPKESCTIYEILEQVAVPFQEDTDINVLEYHSEGLNYVVTVGNVPNIILPEVKELPSAPSQPVKQEERTLPVSQPSLPSPTPKLPHQPPKPAGPSQNPTVQPKPVEIPRTPSPDPVKELPKFVPGMLALCGNCGFLNEDFNKCIRCSRKLPDNVKSIPSLKNSAGIPGAPKRDIAALALAQQAKHQAIIQQQQQKAIAAASASNASTINSTSAAGSKIGPVNSPQKRKSKAAKAAEQESVVILSDEEEEDKPKLSENLLQKLGSSVTICPISKEPSTLDIQRHASSRNNVPPKTFVEKDICKTKLKCRTCRIGSYRCVPVEDVYIETTKVVMKVPHPNKQKGIKTLTIERAEIVKVLASFNSSLPVVFYYLDSGLAKKVRDELDMSSDSDFYFDPLSLEDEAQRRITMLPDDISEETQSAFQQIYGFPGGLLDELNVKEANDILIKTCPKEVVRNTLGGFGAFAEIKQLVTYPTEGRYRITINTEDYICLGQDQFLNDVIIDFYLTYLTENLPAEKKDKIHVFSTFFYRRLTTKPLKASRKSQPSELDPTLTPAQKRHARVKKWTKNVNVFDKDFVVVPINENAHWFLAIICFPGMDGTHTWDGKPIKIEVKSRKKKKGPAAPAPPGKLTVTIKQEKVAKAIIPCDDPDLSDKDEAEGDDSELESDDSEEVPLSQGSDTSTPTTPNSTTESRTPPPVPQSPVPKGPKEPRPPIKQPCILIFDSLAGANRCRVVATLRDYLTCEYKAKMGKERVYNKEVIKGANPKVPQQNNFTDCGLYLLQYVEQFLKDPIKDFHIPIKEIQSWFEEIVVTKKREDIANLIKKLMKESGKDWRLLPDIAFPTFNGKIVEREMEEDEEEEEEEMMEEDEEDDESLFNENQHGESEYSFNTTKESLSDCPSSNDELKGDDESPLKPSSEGIPSDFVAQSALNPKPDLCEFPRHTNKDTLSILKAKRIIRHKNADGDGPTYKKLRSDQE